MPVRRPNVQNVAWAVLWAASAVFLVLAVGVPWLALRFLRQATVVPGIWVEAKQGALQVTDGLQEAVLLPADGRRSLDEGWSILSTDEASEAFIAIADGEDGVEGSGSVVSLQPHTGLRLARVRRRRFTLGRSLPEILLEVRPVRDFAGGLTASSTWGDRRFAINVMNAGGEDIGQLALTPEARVQLDFLADGAFRAVGYKGQVTVSGEEGEVVLDEGERSMVRAGAAPSPPLRGPINVVRNDGFDNDLTADTWRFGRRPEAPEGTARAFRALSEGPGATGGRSIVRFERSGSAGNSADLFFQQLLHLEVPEEGEETSDLDVRRARYIGVSAVLRVLEQSLPGAGQAGSEFPLIIRLRSVDRDAPNPDGCEWVVGFYALPPSPGFPSPSLGQPIEKGRWHAFDSGNLLEAGNPLNFRNRGCDVPSHLLRIEVGTSGHDLISEVDQLAVWIE